MLLSTVALLLSATAFAKDSHHHHHHHIQEDGPFTDHFIKFLKRNTDYKYAVNAYENYGTTGTFGGRSKKGQAIKKTPTLFIHGNSDSALDFGASDGSNSGWNRQLAFFMSRGYTTAELYGLTYGDRTLAHSFIRSINCEDLLGHRKFAEAIMQYTGSYKLNIIAHSMGVTYARALIQGGQYTLHGESCELGESLVERVDSLVAISSANYGMCICEGLTTYPACNATVGYYAGLCASNTPCGSEEICDKFSEGYSTILQQLNTNEKDAKHVYSLWSAGDQIIGVGKNLVHGRQTSLVPHSDKNIRFEGFDHFEMKTETVNQQYHLLKYHDLPKSMFNPDSTSSEDY